MQDKIGVSEVKREEATESVCRTDAEKRLTVSIDLAPFDSADIHLARMWRNDYKIWKWCRQNDLISDVEQHAWFHKQASDPSIKMYKVVMSSTKEGDDKPTITPIGVCGLTSIDMTNRRAEFSLYIAPAYQGFDFGNGALSCLLTHGFKNLGLHIIYGEVFEGNPALDRFRKLGFRDEGLRRDFYFRDGKFINAHLISLRENEWN